MLMQTHRPEVTLGVNPNAARKAFTVEVNSTMFRAAIDGIYSDKIKAPVRELMTNAYDGHIAASKVHVPFDLQLPTAMVPVFRVRDYGIGLSYDEIMGLYSTLYASSKKTSNDAVGMLGLGSKSPFAYTNTFSVTSWYQGIKNSFTCFVGENDVPEIVHVHSELSTDPTGVEVQFSVKSKDIEAFVNATNIVSLGFDPLPNVVNSSVQLKLPDVYLKGDGWRIMSDKMGLRARQGCVIYPIDRQGVTGSSWEHDELKVWDLSMIVDFPIGSLSVSTSRENLGNDDRTKKNVLAQLRVVRTQITKHLQDKIDACPDYLSACKIRHAKEITYGTPEFKLWDGFGSEITWKGQKLKSSFELLKSDGVSPISDRVLDSQFPSPYYNPKSCVVPVHSLEKTVLIHDDVPNFSISRLRTFLMEKNDWDRYLWHRGNNLTEVQAALQDITTVCLSDYEPTKVKREVRAASVKIPTTSWRGNYQSSAETLPQSGIYIMKKDNKIKIGPHEFNYYGFCSHIWTLRSEGLLSETVWNFTSRHTKYLNDPNWKPAYDTIINALKTKFDVKTYLVNGAVDNLPYSSLFKFVESNPEIQYPDLIKEFCAEVSALKKDYQVSNKLKELYEFYLPGELTKLQATAHPLLAKEAAIKAKWPLFATIVDLTCYNIGDNHSATIQTYLNQ